jgi:hypothetical protein
MLYLNFLELSGPLQPVTGMLYLTSWNHLGLSRPVTGLLYLSPYAFLYNIRLPATRLFYYELLVMLKA